MNFPNKSICTLNEIILFNDNITYLNKLKAMLHIQTILQYFYNKCRENVKVTNYFTIFKKKKLLMWWVGPDRTSKNWLQQ